VAHAVRVPERGGFTALGTTDQGGELSQGESLRTFGFDANPGIGTGTSHMLIALGTEAALKGRPVRYTRATKPVDELVDAADEKRRTRPSPATATATCSASTSSAASNRTAAAPDSSSRS
jgi:hypothetical protein